TADVANRRAMLFENFMNVLRKLLATFFRQSGNGNANEAAVIRWIQSEIGSADGLLDRTDKRRVIRLDSNQSRIGGSELCDLVDGSRNSVVIDLNTVEDGNGSTARANRGEVFTYIVNGHILPFV